MVNETNTENMNRELANLKRTYEHELDSLGQQVADAKNNLTERNTVSDHDAFNMSANCQNLAVLAGKIAQTANVIRWMGDAK
jgi:hypothetical protein